MRQSKIWWVHDQRYLYKYRFEYKTEREEGWVINEFIRRISPVIDQLIIRTDEEEKMKEGLYE